MESQTSSAELFHSLAKNDKQIEPAEKPGGHTPATAAANSTASCITIRPADYDLLRLVVDKVHANDWSVNLLH